MFVPIEQFKLQPIITVAGGAVESVIIRTEMSNSGIFLFILYEIGWLQVYDISDKVWRLVDGGFNDKDNPIAKFILNPVDDKVVVLYSNGSFKTFKSYFPSSPVKPRRALFTKTESAPTSSSQMAAKFRPVKRHNHVAKTADDCVLDITYNRDGNKLAAITTGNDMIIFFLDPYAGQNFSKAPALLDGGNAKRLLAIVSLTNNHGLITWEHRDGTIKYQVLKFTPSQGRWEGKLALGLGGENIKLLSVCPVTGQALLQTIDTKALYLFSINTKHGEVQADNRGGFKQYCYE